MIFFGGIGLPLVVGRQWLATEKNPEKAEKREKSAK